LQCSSDTAAADLIATTHLDVQLGELARAELRAIGAWRWPRHKGRLPSAGMPCNKNAVPVFSWLVYTVNMK